MKIIWMEHYCLSMSHSYVVLCISDRFKYNHLLWSGFIYALNPLVKKQTEAAKVIEEQFDRNSALESQLPSKINKQIS